MKNPELFHKTVGILVNAYFKGTLREGDPCGCAVGNLIAANCGYKIQNDEWYDKNGNIVIPNWSAVHNVGNFLAALKELYIGEKRTSISKEIGLEQLHSTGYTEYETCKIEYAFERADLSECEIDDIDSEMYIQLMSVVDCLIEIHEGNETEKSEAKALFNKELIAG